MMKRLLSVVLLVLASTLGAQDDAKEVFGFGPADAWRHEQIPLPPTFAPDMTWKGVEEIRFAPGMFDPKQEDFFTYVIIFSLPGKEDFTVKELSREFLAYYQGLSASVSKSRGRTVDPKTFTIDLKKVTVESSPESVASARRPVTAHAGTMNWVEPFATSKPQVLHVELHSWKAPARRYVFACVSPRKTDHELWNTLRKIRKAFTVGENNK